MNLILIFLLLCFSFSCTKNQEYPMAQKFEEQIKHELPINSSFNDVKLYFEKSKIEYSWDEKNNVFYGIIRNIKKQGFVSENIQVIIYMDKEKKVKLIEIKPIFTGP